MVHDFLMEKYSDRSMWTAEVNSGVSLGCCALYSKWGCLSGCHAARALAALKSKRHSGDLFKVERVWLPMNNETGCFVRVNAWRSLLLSHLRIADRIKMLEQESVEYMYLSDSALKDSRYSSDEPVAARWRGSGRRHVTLLVLAGFSWCSHNR